MKQIITISAKVMIMIIVSISCRKGIGFETDDTFSVYKWKADYTNNQPVKLNDKKNGLSGKPDGSSIIKPLPLANGYHLGNDMGINTAYISLTHEEYQDEVSNLSVDSLFSLVIDSDPFDEYYIGKLTVPLRTYDGIDTVFINILIRENRLEEYFKKIK